MRGMWLAVLAVVVLGCSARSDQDERHEREITHTVLLESYAVDLTWGYRLSGMYIQADGTVWAYERSDTPWYPERLKTGELSERDLLTKHEGAQQIGVVDRTQLRDIAQLIKPAARGPISKTSAVGAGSGTVEVAYLYDPKSSTYREVVLAGQGERVARNAAPEAQLLLDYLREVQRIVQP